MGGGHIKGEIHAFAKLRFLGRQDPSNVLVSVSCSCEIHIIFVSHRPNNTNKCRYCARPLSLIAASLGNVLRADA